MEECCICLEPLKTDIAVLKCLHKFHTKCLYKCYRYSHECPLCREEIHNMARVDHIELEGSLVYVEHIPKKRGCITS
jgi:hypothetical protein